MFLLGPVGDLFPCLFLLLDATFILCLWTLPPYSKQGMYHHHQIFLRLLVPCLPLSCKRTLMFTLGPSRKSTYLTSPLLTEIIYSQVLVTRKGMSIFSGGIILTTIRRHLSRGNIWIYPFIYSREYG